MNVENVCHGCCESGHAQPFELQPPKRPIRFERITGNRRSQSGSVLGAFGGICTPNPFRALVPKTSVYSFHHEGVIVAMSRDMCCPRGCNSSGLPPLWHPRERSSVGFESDDNRVTRTAPVPTLCVPTAGFAPARPCGHSALDAARLHSTTRAFDPEMKAEGQPGLDRRRAARPVAKSPVKGRWR